MRVWWLALGCDPLAREVRQIETCDVASSDCCSSDAGCALAFDGFPYCNDAGSALGGTCGECRDDRDCLGRQECIEVGIVASYTWTICIDPSNCYEGSPYTFTPCAD